MVGPEAVNLRREFYNFVGVCLFIGVVLFLGASL